jgi:hypothetical protein
MSFSIEDLDSDNSSIQDVLLCWGDFGEEDNECDSLNLMQQKLDVDCIPTDVLPPSPERVESPTDFSGKVAIMDRLMKKFPNFVPAALPTMPRKRSRPICMFVNYMGSRESVAAPPAAKPVKMKAEVMEPTPYPTDVPSYQSRPFKKQRLPTDAPVGKAVFPNGPTHFDVSPEPTLGPTSATIRVAPRVY